MKRPKRPRDVAQLGKLIVDIATGAAENDSPRSPQSETPAEQSGRKGGLKGGKARASKLSSRKRREIARKAAAARWKRPT